MPSTPAAILSAQRQATLARLAADAPAFMLALQDTTALDFTAHPLG